MPGARRTARPLLPVGHVFVPVWLPAALSGLECASLRFIFCHFTTSWKITATSAANAPRVVMIAPITVSQPGMSELPPLTVTAMVGGTTSVMGGAGDGVCTAVWPGEGDRVGVGATVGVGWRVTVEWWTLFSSTRATPSPAMKIATAAPIQSCRDKESQDASGSSGGRFTAQTVAPIRARRHRSSGPRSGATRREMRGAGSLERDGSRPGYALSPGAPGIPGNDVGNGLGLHVAQFLVGALDWALLEAAEAARVAVGFGATPADAVRLGDLASGHAFAVEFRGPGGRERADPAGHVASCSRW